MAMNIKDEEAHDLARRLAAATGESLTEAVTIAVRERLERVQRRSGDRIGRVERLRAIGRETAPLLSAVPTVEALLYDERGLPK